MVWLIIIPFIIQALVIGFDEYYFHIKRGLPKWERIGHPIDTLSLIACLIFILFVPFSDGAFKVYLSLAIFSCLMVTKDEWIHKHHCPPAEHWVHAILFINHPIILAGAGLIWWVTTGTETPSWTASLLAETPLLHTMLIGQTGAVILFFLYQVIYWNFIWKDKKQSPSTTHSTMN